MAMGSTVGVRRELVSGEELFLLVRLGWLFDHDPATLRALYAGLAPRHRQDSIETALRELLRFGFLVVN